MTTQILEAIEKIGKEFIWEEYPQRVKWEAYKLSGHIERSFGDIAIFARVWLSGEHYIDGVAFYEAKRQYYKKNGDPDGFSAVKVEQLSRLNSETHASHVLFYDVDNKKSQVHATSVPSIFVHELAQKNLVATSGRRIHEYGNLWVHSLGNNFRGFGLDFRPEAVASVKKAAESKDAPLIILNAGIGMMNIIEPRLDSYCASLNNYEAWIGQNIEAEASQDQDIDNSSDFHP